VELRVFPVLYWGKMEKERRKNLQKSYECKKKAITFAAAFEMRKRVGWSWKR
jgi:hypothetical protein